MGEESDLINKKYAAMIVEADEEASARLEQKVELTRLQFQAVVKDDNIDDLNKRKYSGLSKGGTRIAEWLLGSMLAETPSRDPGSSHMVGWKAIG
eukprot:247007-Prorocentrum_minimum.AAC.1